MAVTLHRYVCVHVTLYGDTLLLHTCVCWIFHTLPSPLHSLSLPSHPHSSHCTPHPHIPLLTLTSPLLILTSPLLPSPQDQEVAEEDVEVVHDGALNQPGHQSLGEGAAAASLPHLDMLPGRCGFWCKMWVLPWLLVRVTVYF